MLRRCRRFTIPHSCVTALSPVGERPHISPIGVDHGVFVVPAAWTVRDREGKPLPHLLARSRLEVGRKIVPTRYDAFRLQVSASYREAFERELKNFLERANWRIVPLKRQRIKRRPRGVQLELNLN